jgi:hypothetical protein
VLFPCSFLARRVRKNSINIQRLNGEFGVSGQLSFFEAQGGLPFLEVSNQNASAINIAVRWTGFIFSAG